MAVFGPLNLQPGVQSLFSANLRTGCQTDIPCSSKSPRSSGHWQWQRKV